MTFDAVTLEQIERVAREAVGRSKRDRLETMNRALNIIIDHCSIAARQREWKEQRQLEREGD
jgi:hypothetical protein